MSEPKPVRKSRPRSAEGPSVERKIRLSPSNDRLLAEEARRQGLSISAVVEQALIARGILPGMNEDPNS